MKRVVPKSEEICGWVAKHVVPKDGAQSRKLFFSENIEENEGERVVPKVEGSKLASESCKQIRPPDVRNHTNNTLLGTTLDTTTSAP